MKQETQKNIEIIEVQRICGECWEEKGIVVPLYNLIDDRNIIAEVHKHYQNTRR